ncbi:fasciclin-like arabinogalactan protein 21 [Diospyros lotus]|uniref:fasciclin-like arabinogalactan protein 21 n=1 Tax=Diospyros lotus TaxID=55363 RepID=UPI0022561A40|nr:fasciclin-like arabinogalactan protein 21 [Diospyros lotus]
MLSLLPLQFLFLTSMIFISTATVASIHQFAPTLAKFGFRHLAAAAADFLSTTSSVDWSGPATIFAPTDSSLLTCPSCSVPLLLREHIVPGLYPLHHLRTLAFGAKIETLAWNRCLTITGTGFHNPNAKASKIFVNGVEIARPDLYNDGNVVVHGLQGFVSHLSSVSCNIERMTSLSFPPPPPLAAFFIMRLMLKDAILRLRISGFSVLAMGLKERYSELLDLRAMTVFALDDASIFADGQSYISDMRLHIVPDRRLMAADLESLAAGTVLRTMEWGQRLLVTTAGGGGPLDPMRINYVKIVKLDLIYNLKIAVHGLSMPLRHVNLTAAAELSNMKRCAWYSAGTKVAWEGGTCETEKPSPEIGSSTTESEDHYGSSQGLIA